MMTRHLFRALGFGFVALFALFLLAGLLGFDVLGAML